MKITDEEKQSYKEYFELITLIQLARARYQQTRKRKPEKVLLGLKQRKLLQWYEGLAEEPFKVMMKGGLFGLRVELDASDDLFEIRGGNCGGRDKSIST